MKIGIFPLLLLAFSLSPPLGARLGNSFTDQEVFDKADFVVIASLVSSSDTTERHTLPNLEPPTQVIGVETEFQTYLVLKGQTDVNKFRLHHYRSAEDFTNGPMLIEVPSGKRHTYLLFLIKERDGRYAPATDQTDPAVQSVLQLRGATGSRRDPPEPAIRIEPTTSLLSTPSRSGKRWTYREMMEKADLLVVGKWSGKLENDESSTLPETTPPVKVIGVTTQFDVSLVFKGPKNLKTLGLHHYRFQYEDEAVRPYAPQLVRIVEPVRRDNVVYPGGGRFLLFLSKEADGRYSPVTGQTNPAVYSVLNLREAVD